MTDKNEICVYTRKNVIGGSTNQSLYEMTQDKLGIGFTWHSGNTECVWNTPPQTPGDGPRTAHWPRGVLAEGSPNPCRSRICFLLSLWLNL